MERIPPLPDTPSPEHRPPHSTLEPSMYPLLPNSPALSRTGCDFLAPRLPLCLFESEANAGSRGMQRTQGGDPAELLPTQPPNPAGGHYDPRSHEETKP